MKKTKILFICTLIMAFICIALVGCSKTEQILSINIKDMDPDAVIEMQMGKFDFSKYTVVVNYDSGSTKEVVLCEDMISELDTLKFYQPGEHVITVSYGKKTCEFKISVKRETFGELKFPENNVFTYDGKEHSVELEGEIPANATVSYIGGNTFVNAGTYDVTAVVTCNGYVTERISTKVTIERAKYNMENVKLEPKEVVYDGLEHSIEISGELPEGVSAPTYYINDNKVSGVADAGEYKVTAVFPNNNPNYDIIPNMETTLKITPAEYDMGEVLVAFKNEDGEMLLGAWKVYDGKGVIFSVDNGNSLENYVNVSYTISDENGKEISSSNTKTGIKNAGIYNVKIDFALLDNKNYKAIQPMELTFEISRAEYDTSNLLFESEITEYNGKPHSLAITIPSNLNDFDFDVTYEYYNVGEDSPIQENGKNVNGVSCAGEYIVRAVFNDTDSNYEPIAPIEATLIIEKKTISASELGFENMKLTYTGESLLPTLGFNAEGHLNVSEFSIFKFDRTDYIKVSGAVDVGLYRAEATVSIADTLNCVFDNEKTEIKIVGEFTVEEAKIDVLGIGFTNNNVSSVNKGETLVLEFDSKNIGGLNFEVTFYKVEGDELISAIEPKTVIPDKWGVILTDVDTPDLEEGTYICAITVSADDSNFVLSNGDATAEYYFEFEILS